MEMRRDATASEEKSSRSYWGFVLLPVVVLVLYVFSAGPARWAADKRILDWKLLYIYKPLDMVAEETPLGGPFARYMRLWQPETFDRTGQDVLEY